MSGIENARFSLWEASVRDRHRYRTDSRRIGTNSTRNSACVVPNLESSMHVHAKITGLREGTHTLEMVDR